MCADLCRTSSSHTWPRLVGELLALDASFVPKSGDRTWGLGWFWSGMARAARRGWRSPCWPPWTSRRATLTLLCARQSPGATPSRQEACGSATDRETTGAAGLALLWEELDAGTRKILQVRWVAADGSYGTQTFVEGVRKLPHRAPRAATGPQAVAMGSASQRRSDWLACVPKGSDAAFQVRCYIVGCGLRDKVLHLTKDGL